MFDEIVRDIRPELTRMYTLMDESLHSHVGLANRVVDYFRDRKGKGVRPIMTLLSALLAGGRTTDATFDAAVALELVHNASLMHDDVVDRSDLRRGAETINRVWDNRVAVLMGDFFLSKSLLRLHEAGRPELFRILAEMVTRLSEGELAQLSGADARSMDEAAYMRVIADKTASMFAACMAMGARSVDAPADVVARLTRVGEDMGLIFQMRDDLFDYLPSADMGKPSGHDIREGKVTLPLLYAFRRCQPAEGEVENKISTASDLAAAQQEAGELHLLLEHPEALTDEEVSRFVDFARRQGGLDYTRRRMEEIADSVRTELSTFPDSKARAALLRLVDYFMLRTV
jgi:octaprenyl-diphosphate synthase